MSGSNPNDDTARRLTREFLPDDCRVCKENRNACMAHVPAEAPHGTE